MDRNSTIGLVLISLILIGYFFYNAEKAKNLADKNPTELVSDTLRGNPDNTPKETELSAPNGSADAETLNNIADDSTRQVELQKRFGSFATASSGEDKEFVLENDEIKVTFSSKGGAIKQAELKNYQTYDSLPLLLFSEQGSQQSISFPTLSGNVTTSELYFSSAGAVATDSGQTIKLVLPADNGGQLVYTYSLNNKGYKLDFNVDLSGLKEVIPPNVWDMNMVWSNKLSHKEKDKEFEDRYTALYFKYDKDDVDNLSESSSEEESPTGALDWISFKQQFFNTTLIAKGDLKFKNAKLNSAQMAEDEDYLKTMQASVILPYAQSGKQSYDMQWYLGPNHYQTLKKMNIDLQEIINLGWVAFISKWLIIPVFNFLEQYIPNYGWIILILTVMIKLLLLPFSYKSYISTAKMRLLKPELDELKEKLKDDQSKFAAEQMKLYSKAGVNPLGGCLPSVLPMPILFAMYYFFPSSIELRQESFLWATDLSTYDSILSIPNIPFYGDHVSLFTLLMAVSSIAYAVINSQMTGQQDGPMKYMPYIFPIMLLGIFNSFPAALTYYYLLQNLLSIAQQYIIKGFFVDEDKLHKQIQENKKKPAKKGGGGFTDRLKKAMEEQQKIAQQQKNKKKK